MTNDDQNKPKTPGSAARRSRFNFNSNPRPQFDLPAEHRHLARDPEPKPKAISQPHLGGRRQLHTEKTGPLIFNVSTLLRDPEGSHRDYDFEQDRLALAQEEGDRPDEATNIKGHVRLTHIRHDILVQGQAEADVVLECVRCLSDTPYHVEVELEELYHPSIDLLTGLPVKTDLPTEEDDLKLDANHLLNLGEAIRQQILVSVPLNPVCGDDCPGYQSQLDLINSHTTLPDLPDEAEEETDDPSPIIDKRWAALSQLLQPGDDKNSKK